MLAFYMIALGGKAKGCNVEIHDVQFTVTNTLEEGFQLVKENWYGIMYKLHVDSYKKIEGVDGYKVVLSQTKDETSPTLYFVCLGDYDKHTGQEIHENILIWAYSEEEAKKQAMDSVSMNDVEKHVDHIVKVEDVLLTNKEKAYYINGMKSETAYDNQADWFGFKRLDI